MSFIRDAAFDLWLTYRIGNRKEPIHKVTYVSETGKLEKNMNHELISKVDDNKLRIVAISDTHSRHESVSILPPCKILLHTGDILMASRFRSLKGCRQKYIDDVHDFDHHSHRLLQRSINSRSKVRMNRKDRLIE